MREREREEGRQTSEWNALARTCLDSVSLWYKYVDGGALGTLSVPVRQCGANLLRTMGRIPTRRMPAALSASLCILAFEAWFKAHRCKFE